ncbi:unnamed protein product [Sphagnum jensenii]
MAVCKFPQNGRGELRWPCWSGASMTDYAMGPSVIPGPRLVALRQPLSNVLLLSSPVQENHNNNNNPVLHSKEAPTSMLVNGYGGGSCLDGAVLDYEKGDGICTQNREMKAIIEAGMSSKQFSLEAKLQDTEGMEEEELFHLLPLKADGHLHHDSSMLNNGSGKGLQRKEARQSDTRRRRWAQADPLLEIWKAVSASKHAAPFRRPVASRGDYDAIVYQRMDLSTIRRHLENELTYSISDMHRDLILTVTNALVYNKKGSDVYNMALKLRAHITKLFEKEVSTTKQKQRVSLSVPDQSRPVLNSKARPKQQFEWLPLIEVGSRACKEQASNDRVSSEHLLSDNTGVDDLPLAPFKKHRTLRRLRPCISSDSVGLASSAEAISGAAMDSSSEEEVAAMLICISSGHGFSCEPVQQAVTLKTETGSRYSGSCYPEKENSCKLSEARSSDSSAALVILDEVELLASPLDDQDPCACNTGLLEAAAKPSSSAQFVERGLYRRKRKKDSRGGGDTLICLNDLVGDTEEQLEVKLSGSTSVLGQVDTADVLVLSFSSTVIEGGSTGLLSGTDNSRCTATVSNSTFLCSEVNQLPSTTKGDKGSGGHKADNGHHKCSSHHDHNSFGIGDGSSQRTCMGLKHKWQEQWRMQSAANCESETHHLLNNLTT